MKFRDLKIEDKISLEKYKAITPKYNCDFCFTDLYIWSSYYHTEICIQQNTLFLRYTIDEKHLYFIPLGNVEYGITELIRYTRQQMEPLRIINLEQQDLPTIPKDFYLVHIRKNDDYVYLSKDLSELTGKKYKSKRNFVNSFQQSYTYEVKKLEDFDEKEEMRFLEIWSQYNPEEDRHSFLGEKEAIHKSIQNKKHLNLDGLLLKCNSKIIGLTIGSYQKDTFITHFEKVDYSYRGASQMINYLLANHVKDRVTYINREEDLGIEGLRTSKLSYHPIQLIQSYTAYYKPDFKDVFPQVDEIIETE